MGKRKPIEDDPDWVDAIAAEDDAWAVYRLDGTVENWREYMDALRVSEALEVAW